MNHLAHLFLSGQNDKWMVGNFIADAVKGKKYQLYDREIANGILIHRLIDTFTDGHELVRHSKSLLRPKYGLYAGVLVDMFYDHVLARNWTTYHSVPLASFAENAYRIFHLYFEILPDRNKVMLTYMQRENWLVNYSHLQGIERSLKGLSRRIRNNPGIDKAAWDLSLHYEQLKLDFEKFFPSLIRHVEGASLNMT